MAGRPTPKVPNPHIPHGTLVRDRLSGRIGVLYSYGPRGAWIRTGKSTRTDKFLAKIVNLEEVTQEEIAAMLQKEAEGLV